MISTDPRPAVGLMFEPYVSSDDLVVVTLMKYNFFYFLQQCVPKLHALKNRRLMHTENNISFIVLSVMRTPLPERV